MGVATFSPAVKAYADAHTLHHRLDTFATLADPDAQLIWRLGFRPGRSYRRMVSGFFTMQVSPRLHGPMSWARLKHTFGPDQPRWRRAVAIGGWYSDPQISKHENVSSSAMRRCKSSP